MDREVKLPQWGMSMAEGTVVSWLAGPGDEISVGQPLVEVESSKTTNVMEALYAGTLTEILVDEGETVPVNTVLAVIATEDTGGTAPGPAGGGQTGAADEDAEEVVGERPKEPVGEVAPAQAQSPAAVGDAAAPAPEAGAPSPAGGASGRTAVQVVPLARKLAKEHGIDLAEVDGSGPRGRITVADVRALLDPGGTAPTQVPDRDAADAAAAPAAAGTRAMSRMRQVIAERMVGSLQGTAQLTMTSTADVTRFVQLREDWGEGTRPSYADAVIRACGLALRRHPVVRSRIEGATIVEPDGVDIGMAVALDEGLVVPVVRDPDRLTLAELAPVTAALAEQARAGALGPDAFAGATFSVTSLGGQGIDAFTPVLNPPEAAILGIGRTREVAVRTPDGMAWRSQMTLSLTIDHRLVDGYPGALFLADVVRLLEDPGQL